MDANAIAALCRAENWPHPVESVRLVETHISWVLLTGRFAYKIKKPVNFGFLDFSTLAQRRHCCEEEVRLNRRLAPNIYLEVVPVAGPSQAPAIAPDSPGDSGVLDYAVKMAQFDTERQFDRLLARGELGAEHMDEAARVLATFHREASAATPGSGFGTALAATGPVLDNFLQVQPQLDSQFAEPQRQRFGRIERWSQAACEQLEAAFDARLAEGFVRECHGDLHLRNIVVSDGRVTPFDCIEFNPALRWIDVMSELAFLLMDLDDHGRPDLARRLLNTYLEYSGDYAGLRLLRFYQVYRAMVRVKVESLRLAQLTQPDRGRYRDMEQYLALAESYTKPLKPGLIIAHGLSGSGKTHASQRLLERCDLVRLRSDVERKRLFGLAPLQSSGSARDAGIYTVEANTRTYEHLETQARSLLAAGFPVLVDAAFLKREEREQFRRVAVALGLPFAIMHCESDAGVQRERLTRRQRRADDASEADQSVLELQLAVQEPLQAEERGVFRLDTTSDADLSAIQAFLAAPRDP